MKYLRKTKTDIKNDFLISLLLDRGIINSDSEFCEKFFNPKKETNELNSELLDNMENGYNLLMKHLKNHSLIRLPVDPDCDGFTSSALFYNYLMDNFSQYEPNIIYHIPEGKEHGLDSIMDWFPDNGENCLIVLPDSSSNDYEYHKILRDRGYELLVLDHHLAEKYSQDAIVINN